MADKVALTIDGKAVEVPHGTLIIEAAKKAGVEIPTFCYDKRLKSVGACRMCLVEVEKMPKLIASCATPVAPDMVVHTESEKVVKARKGVLEFLLINHPLDCPTCDKGGECPLQDQTFAYGPPVSRYRENKIRFIDETADQKFDDIPLGPEILLCRNRCIMCYKCVRIVRELAGEADLGVFQRGAYTSINVLSELEFSDEFSGNTVEYCPVGALTSRSFRYKIRDWLLKKAPSICNLCSDGCNMQVEWSAGKVRRHMSRGNSAVDNGWLCDRGRYGFDISKSKERLSQPLIRRGNALEACAWEEADALVARHLGKIVDGNRATEIGVVGSATLSNEEAYAVRHFFEDVVNTSNIDFQTDLARPVEPRLLDMMGLDGTIDDIEKSNLFLFVGIDPATEHPIMSLRIRKAISRRKAKAVFIGSCSRRLGYFPVENIMIPFGSEPLALEYVIAGLNGKNPPSTRQMTSIDTAKLDALVDLLKRAEGIHIMAGRAFLDHPHRDPLLLSLVRLKNERNARLSILDPRANFMGVSHFGLYGGPGHSFDDMLSKISTGEIKTLFVFGSDPVDEYPDREYVQEALKKVEFLVVVNPFITPTAALASIVYPQALLCDYGGSFVNIEGRIQRFEAMEEIGRSPYRPVWALLGEISSLMEMGEYWRHQSQVRRHMVANLKGMEIFNNIPDGGAIIEFGSEDNPEWTDVNPAKLPSPPSDRPYVLQWTPTVHHNGWITAFSENLMRLSGKQAVNINPEDAGSLDVSDGSLIRIGGEDTAINLPVAVSTRVNKGEILIENSFADNPANRLMKKGEAVTYVSLRKI